MEIIMVIFICVVMPVAIVLITNLKSMNETNKRTQVLLKAIDTNPDVNVDRLAEAMTPPRPTQPEVQNKQLLRGCIYSLLGLMGIVLTVLFQTVFYTMVDDELIVTTAICTCICVALGIAYLIAYFVMRRQMKD